MTAVDTIKIMNVPCPQCGQEIPVQTFYRMEEPGFLHVRGAREIPRPRWMFEPESTEVVCKPCGLLIQCKLRYMVGYPDCIIVPVEARLLPLPLLKPCTVCEGRGYFRGGYLTGPISILGGISAGPRCTHCDGTGWVKMTNWWGRWPLWELTL